MNPYIRYRHNCKCSCQRCVVHGLMGPAILITVGILLLFSTLNIVSMDHSAPVLMIVIGGLLLVRQKASTEGHIPRWGYAVVASPAAATPPPPAPNSSNLYEGR